MKTSYSKGYNALLAFIFLLGISIASAQTELRINTGGSATTYQGENFIADQYANTGTTLNRPQTGLPQPFQSFRFSRSQQLSYNIPLSDGAYTVKLYFAELWFGATGGGSGGTGSRIFDVTIEGQLAEDNLDIFSEVGADAMLVKTHTVTVSGGVLNIDFDSRDQVGGERHPVINAIEVISNSTSSEITIQTIADQHHEINDIIDLAVNANGGDPNLDFTFSMLGAPAGISINETTGQITGTIDDHAAHHGSSNDGNYQVIVTASKGAASVSTSYNWMITDPSCAWNTLADANIERFEAISQKIGDKLYVLGGFKPGVLVVAETEIYDTTNDTWSIGAAMPIPVTHTAAVAVGSEIWILGGFEGDNPGVAIKAVQIYNTQTDSWSVGPDLPNLVGSGAGALSGNKIHFFGGLMPDRQTDVADHWVLDLTNIAAGWTAAAPMPNARNHHSGISVNGMVYAIGGQVGHDGPKYDTKFVHVYNPNTDTWTRLTDLDRTRSHFKAATTLHNGKIVIVGGIDNGPIVNDISVFDPQLNSWSELCKLPGEGLEEAAAQAFGDRLIVSGGRPIQDSNTIIKETKWLQLAASTSQPPIANASNDKNITLPTTTLALSGSGSDPDGGSVTYFWNQISGPNAALMSSDTNAELDISGLIEGTYVFRLTVTDDENESDFDEVSVIVNGELIVPDFSLRINTGGPEVVWSGETFIADQYRSGGSVYTVDFPINNTTNDALYQTEIFGPATGPFTYEIPVPESGEYKIRLHFAELYFGIQTGGVGSRIFDVAIEGNEVISNLDMLTEVAPATAIIKEFNNVQISDGFATITFTGVTQRAKISGIEILSINEVTVDSDAKVNTLFIQGGYQFEDEIEMTDNLRFGIDQQNDFPAINILAEVSDETSKVIFKFTQLDGNYTYEHTDNEAPFNTSSANDQNMGIPTNPGTYLLEVIPYNVSNDAGETFQINYETFSQCEVYFEDLVIETSGASCETSSDGIAFIDGSYTFDLNNTGFVYDSSIDKYKNENLAPGTYSVTLVNAPNCSKTFDFVINSQDSCGELNLNIEGFFVERSPISGDSGLSSYSLNEGDQIRYWEFNQWLYAVGVEISSDVKSVQYEYTNVSGATTTEDFNTTPTGYLDRILPGIEVGVYSITVTPYSEANQQGEIGMPVTITYEIIEDLEISELYVVRSSGNAATIFEEIAYDATGVYYNGADYYSAVDGEVFSGISPIISSNVKSVHFRIYGPSDSYENEVINDEFPILEIDEIGRYDIYITPYSGENLQGVAGFEYYYRFNITDHCEVVSIDTFNASSCNSSDGYAILKDDLNNLRFNSDLDDIWVYDESLQAFKASNLAVGTYNFSLDNFGCTLDKTFVIEAPDCEEPNAEDIWLEAECAIVGSNWSIVSDTDASNGQYVLPPVGFSSSGSNNADNIVKFDFNASQGVYKIYTLVKTPTTYDDSFYVRINGGAWKRWNNIPQVNSFQWNQIHDRELQYVPLTFNLTDGTNTLEIANREDGAGLDKVFITKSDELPSGFGLTDASCSSNSSSGKSVVSNPSILSPNPVVNSTRLSFVKPVQLIEIQVYDITGRLVHSYSGAETADQEAYLLNVNSLPAGTYYLKSQDTTGAFHQKQMVIKK